MLQARLESKLDYLETEITHLNQLLKQVGFANGIETLKKTIELILLDEHLIEGS